MKILALLASARRKGNSTFLAEKLLTRAESLGAKVQRAELGHLNFKGCQGCLACKKTARSCVLKDDLAPVLQALLEVDAVVAASPIYWYDISAQLKAFVDRGFCLMKPDYLTAEKPSRLPAGVKMIMVLAQGSGLEELDSLSRHYGRIFSRQGYQSLDIVYTQHVRHIGDAAQNPAAIARAEKAAEALFT